MSRLALFAVLVLLPALVACSTLPRPFRPVPDEAPNPLVALGVESAGVFVEPVDGPPTPMARLLSESVAAELSRRNIPATTAESRAKRYVLRGRSEPNTKPGAPHIVLIHWTLLDGNGQPIGKYTQGVEGTWAEWEYGDSRIIEAVGEGIAKPVATLIGGEDDSTTAAPPERHGLWVRTIEGAPGDGNPVLTRAIQVSLKAGGVAVAASSAEARFVLEGRVTVEPGAAGEENVRIVWTIVDADGAVMGRATQENAVPRGSLGGRWGQVAGFAAEAAVDGIADILERARSRRPRIAIPQQTQMPPAAAAAGAQGTAGGAPAKPSAAPLREIPPAARIPRIPGRALPPP